MDEMVDWEHLMIGEIQNYSDDQLWDVINNYPKQDTRLNKLIKVGKQSKLSADELTELKQQIDVLDQQILLRSEALLLPK